MGAAQFDVGTQVYWLPPSGGGKQYGLPRPFGEFGACVGDDS
jgi:hypothetical protein